MNKEEAMKILKDFHDKSALFSVRTALETLHPELKESEDEKIRKTIVRFFKDNYPNETEMYDGFVTVGKAIAWLENIPYTIDHEKREGFHLGYKAGLEKQGEQKPIIKMKSAEESLGISSEEYNDIVNECLYGESKAAEWKQENVEELSEFENAMMHIGYSFFRKRGGLDPNDTSSVKVQAQYLLELAQKPAWSEEDINKPNGGIVMEDFNDGNGFYKINLAYLNKEQVEQIEELVKRWGLQPKEDEDESIVSDLLDYFDEDKCLKHEVNDIVKWLKTIKPQQKGCGENEIKTLDNLITYLDGRKDLLEEIKSTYIDWLKSLRPQNRWKPSEEQIEAVKRASNGSRAIAGNDYLIMESLYNDLKKLKGE